jgi:hypothetical protein
VFGFALIASAWLIYNSRDATSCIPLSSNADSAQVASLSPQREQRKFFSSQYRMSYLPPYSSKPNAIIYMAQKSHKVYLRDSLALLTRSLDLLFQNYLLIDEHYKNATVFIFHTGDFDYTDIQKWEKRYPPEAKGVLQEINLLNTPYWKVPPWLDEADLPNWRNPEYNIGYRHM